MKRSVRIAKEHGFVTLEALITVLFFMVIMFLFYGLFLMYMAQNATAHAVLQTSQSLSVDNYAANQIGDGNGFPNGIKDLMVKFFKSIDVGLVPEDDDYFVSNTEMKTSTDKNNVPEMVKKRFVAYLAGGDEAKADSMLKSMNVEKGLEGLDFSESEIVDSKYIKVVLMYQLNYEFQIAELGKVNVKQESLSKLWESK
ncbi:MAG: hypothetical protein K2I06_02700 [Ruminococcus sp.]|nr:hypothetical protein [Ruminococcus sp.]